MAYNEDEMRILDGRLTAERCSVDLKRKIFNFTEQNQSPPSLSMVLVGDNPAGEVYVRQKVKSAKQVGIHSEVITLSKNVSFSELKQSIQKLNDNPAVHGVLVQLPLPSSLNWKEVVSCIHPLKDVDCLTVENQGLLWSGRERVSPCTPAGIIKLLKHYDISLKGKNVVVVGRSQIVGLPMLNLLLKENATVTVCHSHTDKVSQWTRGADIVVSAVGCVGLLGKEDFKKGAVVVDVGIHREEQQNGKTVLKGDVRFEELKDHVAWATPVPGGVGPMTVTQLLENTFRLACLNTEKSLKG